MEEPQIYKVKWVKARELKVLENDTRECTLNVADVAAKHTTFRTVDAVTADSRTRKSENTTGLRKPCRDKDKVLVK